MGRLGFGGEFRGRTTASSAASTMLRKSTLCMSSSFITGVLNSTWLDSTIDWGRGRVTTTRSHTAAVGHKGLL